MSRLPPIPSTLVRQRLAGPLLTALVTVVAAAGLGFGLSQTPSAPGQPDPDGGTPPAGTGSVVVHVQTGAAEPLPDHRVVLEVFDGSSVRRRLTGETGPRGRVRFEDVPAGPAYHVRPRVEYRGASYTGTMQALPVDGEVDSRIAVHEPVTEGRPLQAQILHLIVNVVEPGLYQVAQVMHVQNPGEAAFLGGPTTTDGGPSGLQIPLPEAARQVQPLPGPQGGLEPSSLVIEDERILETRPFAPGVRQVAVTYEIVAGPEGTPLRLELPYPTRMVSLLVGGSAAAEIDVRVDDLEEQEAETIQGTRFRHWTASSLDAGASVSFSIGPSGPALGRTTWALLALGVALLAASLVAGLGGGRRAALEERREELIEELARIDLGRQRGEIDDQAYFYRRSAVLERILNLDRQLADADPGEGAAPGDSGEIGEGSGDGDAGEPGDADEPERRRVGA